MKNNVSPLPVKNERENPANEFFRELVHVAIEEVLETLAEIVQGQPAAPAYVNGKTLAERLGVSPATVTKLKKEGMPCLLVGQEARYSETECIAWLKARQGGSA